MEKETLGLLKSVCFQCFIFYVLSFLFTHFSVVENKTLGLLKSVCTAMTKILVTVFPHCVILYVLSFLFAHFSMILCRKAYCFVCRCNFAFVQFLLFKYGNISSSFMTEIGLDYLSKHNYHCPGLHNVPLIIQLFSASLVS